jgi:hypothetical protein
MVTAAFNASVLVKFTEDQGVRNPCGRVIFFRAGLFHAACHLDPMHGLDLRSHWS